MGAGLIFNPPKITGIRGNHWRCFAEPQSALHAVEVLGTAFVGFGSYMNGGRIRSYSEIGRYCSIGRDVSVGLGKHDLTSTSTSSFFNLSNSAVPYDGFASRDPVRRTIVGNDVWVGDGVRINTGVVVGDGAVIATGAVVTKDVAPYSIVGGLPARHIRWRFDEDLRRELYDSQWWTYDPGQLADVMVSDPSRLMQSWPALVSELRPFPVQYVSISPRGPEATSEESKLIS